MEVQMEAQSATMALCLDSRSVQRPIVENFASSRTVSILSLGRAPILLCLSCVTVWTVMSGRATNFASVAASNNHPEGDEDAMRHQRYGNLLPLSALTYECPVIVVVRDLRPDPSIDRLEDPSGSFANFSRALEARLSPIISCLSRQSNEFSEDMLTVQRLEGYHLTSLPAEEKQALLAHDGRSAVLRIMNCRGGQGDFVSRILHITAFVRDTAIPEVMRDVAPGMEDWLQFGVLEITQVLMEAKDVVLHELSHTDAVTLPVAMLVLIVAAGPLALSVLLALPIALLLSFSILDFFLDRIRFSFLGPPVFATLAVALSLDYALLLLCRFNEDLRLGCEDAAEASDASIARTASRAAVRGMMHHAGFAVFSSSLLLAFAFATLFVFAASDDVKSIGFGGAVTVLSCVCVSLALLPALLLSLVDLAPRQLVRVQLCCRWPRSGGRSMPRCFDNIFNHPQLARCYQAAATLGIEQPRSVLLAMLFLTLPLFWRAVLLRPSMDQAALVPLGSLYARNEQVLVNSDLPPSHVLPPFLVLEAERRQTNVTSLCEDRDEVLASFLPYMLPSQALPVGAVSCASLAPVLCDTNALLHLFPDDLDVAFASQQAELLQSSLCPLSCDACGSSDMPVLSDDVFEKLHTIEAFYEASLEVAKPRSHLIADGHLVHIGRLGPDIVSAADARRYISGRVTFDESDAARASAFRANFARLSNLDGTGTVVQIFHPFRCMSSGGADWGREFLRKLSESGLHDVDVSSSPTGVGVVLLMHEQSLWEEMDSTFESLLSASLAAIGCLLLLTGFVFRSIVLPPRLLFTVFLTIGIACGVCGFVDDGFSLPGVYWVLPPIAIPVITGLTLDYDLYILTRVMEYRMQGRSTAEAFEIGLEKSRGVISMAGVVMAAAFSALCFSELLGLRQLGVLLVTATLCDTFLIRPLVVPACAFAFGNPEANWWPRRMPAVHESTSST